MATEFAFEDELRVEVARLVPWYDYKQLSTYSPQLDARGEPNQIYR